MKLSGLGNSTPCAWALLLLVTLLLVPAPARSADEGVEWELLSDKGRPFAPLRADQREAQFRFGFMLHHTLDLYEDLVMGTDLGLLRLRFADDSVLALTGRGILAARFNVLSDSFDLQNSDFIGGPAIAYRRSRWGVDLWVHHQSSHLGDEVLEAGGRRRIDYGLERVRLMGDLHFSLVRFYLGGSVVVHSFPADLRGRTVVQAGAELVYPVGAVPFFAAVDTQVIASEVDFGGVTLQVGAELGFPTTVKNRQRFFVEFYQGYSHMGQYYDQRERYGLVGLAYVFR